MNDSTYYHQIDSPVGPLKLEATHKTLTTIRYITTLNTTPTAPAPVDILAETEQQLNEYFNGGRRRFNLSLEPDGTDFERQVWNELTTIPFGSTITYKQLAKKLGDVNKVRAVGRANGQNPLPIVIPCHRVIGAGNKLIGYAGGIPIKQWLLKHEGAILL